MECNLVKKIYKFTLAILLLLSLCGCYELGDYEEGEYFEYFPTVELIEIDKSRLSYSVEDYFYTEEGINDYVSKVPYKEYLYLAVQVKEDLLLNELSLSFCSEQNSTLEVSIFILNTLPSSIRGYDDPLYDEENNEIEYDDPTESIETKIIFLESSKWVSTYILDYAKNDYVSVNGGQYIVIRFENNSYIGKERGINKTTFTTTNLLIKAQGS